MNSVRFFTGVHPHQKLFLSNGAAIVWTNVGRDEGIFATNNAFIAEELVRMAQGGVGGVREISAEEYEAKKNARVPAGFTPFREELSRAGYRISPMANPALRNPGSIPTPLQSAEAAAAVSVATAPVAQNAPVSLPTVNAPEPAIPKVRRGPGRPRKNP